MRKLAAIPRAHDPEKLIINLWKNTDGSVFTRSVEIVDKVSRVRFSFNTDCLINGIFKRPIAESLHDILGRINGESGMLMMPDYKVALQDLVLEGCRVLVTAVENGIENIMIRFVRYFGRVASMFKDGFVHRDALSEGAVDQAVDALERVYMPLRNFSHHLDDMLRSFPNILDDAERSFLRRIKGEIDELAYYSDLITHFVNSQGTLNSGELPEVLSRVDKPPEPLLGIEDAEQPEKGSLSGNANAVEVAQADLDTGPIEIAAPPDTTEPHEFIKLPEITVKSEIVIPPEGTHIEKA